MGRNRTRWGMLIAVVLTSIFASPLLADGTTVVKGETGAALDQVVQATGGKDFWGAVLVARGEEVLLAKGYGFADYKSTPIAPDSFFELASMSKIFTAMAILRLEMQGRLSTDDPVSRFFPDLPDDKKGITVFHLLTHTSGIGDNDTVMLPYATEVTRDEMVKHVMSFPCASKPGEIHRYNNAGYAMLAAVIEKASGGSFEEYMRKEIFAPVRMTDTGFVGDKGLDPARVTARSSEGEIFGSAVDFPWSWGYRGMGGMVSTLCDLHKWYLALKGQKLFDEAAKAKAFTAFKDDYGCGWMLEKTATGKRRQFHTGGVRGYRTLFAQYPEDDVVIVVLTNEEGDVHAMRDRLYGVVCPEEAVASLIEATILPRVLKEAGGYAELEGPEPWKVSADSAKHIVVMSHTGPDGKTEGVSLSISSRATATLVEQVEAALLGKESVPDAPQMRLGFQLVKYGPADPIRLGAEAMLRLTASPIAPADEGETGTYKSGVCVSLLDQVTHWEVVNARMNFSMAKKFVDDVKKASTRTK